MDDNQQTYTPFEQRINDDEWKFDKQDMTADGTDRWLIDVDSYPKEDIQKQQKTDGKIAVGTKKIGAHLSHCYQNPSDRPAPFRPTIKKGDDTKRKPEVGHCGCRDCTGCHVLGSILDEYEVKRQPARRFTDGSQYNDVREAEYPLNTVGTTSGDGGRNAKKRKVERKIQPENLRVGITYIFTESDSSDDDSE
jgi:hypothetical protein